MNRIEVWRSPIRLVDNIFEIPHPLLLAGRDGLLDRVEHHRGSALRRECRLDPAGIRQCVKGFLDGQREADRRGLGDVVAGHLGPRGETW